MQIREVIYLLTALMLAALVAFTFTPSVSVLAYRIGAIDVPKDNRRMHKQPIPRIGGLAIFAGFIVASLVFCKLTPELITIYVGGLIIVAVGVIDDAIGINAWLKLAAQIGVAFVAVWQGVVIEHISLFGKYIHFGMWSIPITVIWIVGLTNAINLIDGLDGLSCGVSAISSVSLLVVMLLQKPIDTQMAMVTAAVVGSCIGFLPFNFNPAKIFMGDTGALFLGYTMAIISVSGVFKVHTVISFAIPMAIFALPLFDTTFAFARRIIHGKNPFSPDRGHIHHRLIDLGFSQKQSVCILYAICAILGTSAVMFSGETYDKALLIIAVGIFIFFVNFYFLRHGKDRSHMAIDLNEPTLPISDDEKTEIAAPKEGTASVNNDEK